MHCALARAGGLVVVVVAVGSCGVQRPVYSRCSLEPLHMPRCVVVQVQVQVLVLAVLRGCWRCRTN